MADYGLLPEGLVIKPGPVIRDEIEADIRETFGLSIALGDRTLLGHIVGIDSDRLAQLWELLEAVYNALSPSASGASLEQVCAITGTIRLPATYSTVTLTLTGLDASVIDEGSIAATESTEQQFQTLAECTLAELDAWVNTTAYVLGDRVANSSRSYECITAGTSAGSGGPTTTDDDITDGTVHWIYLGEGTAAVDVESAAIIAGVTVATAGDIITIITPRSGWSSVINLLDADEGRALETDEALRVRRQAELTQSEVAVPDAIAEVLRQVSGVTSVTVFYNPTDSTDANGLPPHSVEALVRGGADQDIWDALFGCVAAGILTHGTEDGTVTDSSGVDQDVSFSRFDEVLIYVDISVDYDADLYPSDGDDQVALAIVAYGDAGKAGRDARASGVAAQAFQVAGVLGAVVTDIDDDDIGAPSTTTVVMSARQLAVYDTSRITVTSSAVTP